MFRFGPVQIETENPKETAKFIEFMKRLEAAGFIEFQKFDNRGKPRYSLTLEAYERFREDQVVVVQPSRLRKSNRGLDRKVSIANELWVITTFDIYNGEPVHDTEVDIDCHVNTGELSLFQDNLSFKENNLNNINMKKFLISMALAAAALSVTSCQQNGKWEYKVVKVAGTEGSNGKFGGMQFSDPSGQLNKLGEEGWELVSSFTEESTVHPNFGNSEYVTGLQPNTRTEVVNFVLKRRK